MGRRTTGLAGFLAVAGLCGCQVKPDIEEQRDLGAKPEISQKEVGEQQSREDPSADTTTERSVRQRAAADSLAGRSQ